jgi:hypothetical protein
MGESDWTYDFLDGGLIEKLVNIGSGPEGVGVYFIEEPVKNLPEHDGLDSQRRLSEEGLATEIGRGINKHGKKYVEYTLTPEGKRIYFQILDMFRKEGKGYLSQI